MKNNFNGVHYFNYLINNGYKDIETLQVDSNIGITKENKELIIKEWIGENIEFYNDEFISCYIINKDKFTTNIIINIVYDEEDIQDDILEFVADEYYNPKELKKWLNYLLN